MPPKKGLSDSNWITILALNVEKWVLVHSMK